MDLSVLFKLSYGMYIIGADDNSRPAGCIVNTVFQITSENPILALSMNKDNYTFEVMKRTGKFSISIISEQTPPVVISKLGFSSGRSKDKFIGIDYELENRLPLVKENCCGYIICDLIGMHETETHYIMLGRVTDTRHAYDAVPMTYKYYHDVVKGKTPKTAPSFRG